MVDNHTWNIEASRAGICGSEYIDDPKRVFDRVRSERTMTHERFLRTAQKVREHEARIIQLEAALRVYAEKANWKCARCSGTDSANCLMSKWVGPVNEDESGQAWNVAEAALITESASEYKK